MPLERRGPRRQWVQLQRQRLRQVAERLGAEAPAALTPGQGRAGVWSLLILMEKEEQEASAAQGWDGAGSLWMLMQRLRPS